MAQGKWGEAAGKLAEVVNDDMFRSLEGKSKHQLWLELCEIVTKHPEEVVTMKVEAIIRGGIRKFTDEVHLFVLICDGSGTASGWRMHQTLGLTYCNLEGCGCWCWCDSIFPHCYLAAKLPVSCAAPHDNILSLG